MRGTDFGEKILRGKHIPRAPLYSAVRRRIGFRGLPPFSPYMDQNPDFFERMQNRFKIWILNSFGFKYNNSQKITLLTQTSTFK